MKIIVYAICKDEEQFVDRWYESAKEADEVYVLDTGSLDNTVRLLKEKGVHVKSKKYKKFRFDKARNDSLKLVPDDADICVCFDLDEVFEKGWRKRLEKCINKETTRVGYTYNWLIENNNPKVTFYLDKIHTKKDYMWINPVHEVLKNINNNEKYILNDKIILNHYPDKSKSRSSYLPLLELSVQENPMDDRNVHYLGREYMYYGRYNECIDTLIKHLNLKSSTWRDERCASMRFIARSYQYLGRIDEARMWLDKAIKEAPYLRDPYVERGILEYNINNHNDAIYYMNEALKIKYNPKTYINEIFSYDSTIYDILSISYYNTKDYNESLKCVNKALKLNNDERIKNNKMIIEEKIKTQL